MMLEPQIDARAGMRQFKAGGDRADIPVLRAGVLAQAFCRRGGQAEVAAVFARSFYLCSGDIFVCVGEPAIGNGPLTLIADFGALRRLPQPRLRVGEGASIAGGRVALDSVRFILEGCETWRLPRWPRPRLPDELRRTGEAMVRLMAAVAPAAGLAPLFAAPSASEAPLTRIARPRVAHFQARLRDVLAAGHASSIAAAESVRGLVGLGPGLTPSGDDFLTGALATLDALAAQSAHAALASAIAALPRGLTSPLSDGLLRAAAAGHCGEHLCAAVSAVLSGDVDSALAAIRKIGHSSGWDMLAGILSTLQVIAAAPGAAARRQGRAP